MKNNFIKLLKIISFSGLLIIGLLTTGCLTSTSIPYLSGETVLHSTHEQRPDWTFDSVIPGDEHRYLYYVGISDYKSTERDARNNALTNARGKIAHYVGEHQTSSVGERTINEVAGKFIKKYEPNRWYIKKVRRTPNGAKNSTVQWKAIVQLVIPRKIINEAIQALQSQDTKQVDRLVPGGEISAIEFRSTSTVTAQLSRQLKQFFTKNDKLAGLIKSPDPNTQHLIVDCKAQFETNGSVGGGMNSYAMTYTIQVTLHRPQNKNIMLRTFKARQTTMASTRQSALNRIARKIVENHREELTKLLESTL